MVSSSTSNDYGSGSDGGARLGGAVARRGAPCMEKMEREFEAPLEEGGAGVKDERRRLRRFPWMRRGRFGHENPSLVDVRQRRRRNPPISLLEATF
ncbi:hypothetical protein U1Q18_018372 [Sarracenia purpurea var. burkii]